MSLYKLLFNLLWKSYDYYFDDLDDIVLFASTLKNGGNIEYICKNYDFSVLPGWYIRIRKMTLGGNFKIFFYNGILDTEVILSESSTQLLAILAASTLVAEICFTQLLKWKQSDTGLFNKICDSEYMVWETNGRMGKVPIGQFAKGFFGGSLSNM